MSVLSPTFYQMEINSEGVLTTFGVVPNSRGLHNLKALGSCLSGPDKHGQHCLPHTLWFYFISTDGQP